jgi:hypothetical protein
MVMEVEFKRLDDSAFSIVGSDAGVDFISTYIINKDIIINILSNITNGIFEIRNKVFEEVYKL